MSIKNSNHSWDMSQIYPWDTCHEQFGVLAFGRASVDSHCFCFRINFLFLNTVAKAKLECFSVFIMTVFLWEVVMWNKAKENQVEHGSVSTDYWRAPPHLKGMKGCRLSLEFGTSWAGLLEECLDFKPTKIDLCKYWFIEMWPPHFLNWV